MSPNSVNSFFAGISLVLFLCELNSEKGISNFDLKDLSCKILILIMQRNIAAASQKYFCILLKYLHLFDTYVIFSLLLLDRPTKLNTIV